MNGIEKAHLGNCSIKANLVIDFGLPGDGYKAGCHRCHFLRKTSLRVEMTFHDCPKNPVNGLVAWNGHIQDEEVPENTR